MKTCESCTYWINTICTNTRVKENTSLVINRDFFDKHKYLSENFFSFLNPDEFMNLKTDKTFGCTYHTKEILCHGRD